MSGWDDLVTVALLGTERRPLPATLAAPVARLAAAEQDAGLAVLGAAAGYTSYRVAGARPQQRPAPRPAPRQVTDPAPEPAQALLARLLRSRDVGLVEEWLTECVRRGLGVRAGLWVPLATAAAAAGGPDGALVMAAIGRRGAAFVDHTPAGRRLAAAAEPARAAHAAEPGRRGADSGTGRRRAPGTGTGRRRAPEPGPTWSAELTEHALAAVRVTRSLGRRRVSIETPRGGIGLREAVAGTDLDAWQPHTGLAPGPLLRLVHEGAPDRVDELADGWRSAAVAQAHRPWATALVVEGRVSPALAALVPPEELARAAQDWVAGRLPPTEAARSLGVLPGPWSEEVARAALRLLGAGVLDPRTSRRLSLVVARRAPVSAHVGVLALAGPEHGLVEAADVMSLRLEIRRRLGTPPVAGPGPGSDPGSDPGPGPGPGPGTQPSAMEETP